MRMNISYKHQSLSVAYISLINFYALSITIVNVVFAGDRGNGLFASLAQLENLWFIEKEIVRTMETISNISKIHHPPIEM